MDGGGIYRRLPLAYHKSDIDNYNALIEGNGVRCAPFVAMPPSVATPPVAAMPPVTYPAAAMPLTASLSTNLMSGGGGGTW